MSAFASRVVLGRTGLSVSRLGIGSAYGVSAAACRHAFERGINYFFWGSVRTPGMGAAIRDIVAAGRREQLVVVLECYARLPALVARSVEQGLRRLHIDYADVLLLGWYDRRPAARLLAAVEALRRRGRFRYLGISAHDRRMFRAFLADGRYDLFHLRYNAAHRGAESDIFPFLPAANAPGVAAFTATRWGDLLAAKNMPPGCNPPSAVDCYRFALSHPCVQVVLCGPRNDREMETALTVMQTGPLTPEERERLQHIGDHVHARSSLMSTLA